MPSEQRFFVIGNTETDSFLLYFQGDDDKAPRALRAFDDGDEALICLKLLMGHGRELRPTEIPATDKIDTLS